MKTNLLIFAALILSYNAFADTTYRCEPFEVLQSNNLFEHNSLSDFKSFTFKALAGQRTIVVPQETVKSGNATHCQIPGRDDVVFSAGSGPNSWGYKVPEAAFAEEGPQVIQVGYAWDEDSDGNACSYALYQCTKSE
jgi:hypothetical protein